MKIDFAEKTGMQLLVNRYRKMFRIPENLNHYSEDNFKIAERKFLKYAISCGKHFK